MGSVQKLDNNNYFINTVGSGGHIIEVTENNNIVWNGQYDFTEAGDPAGNYRSYKVPSIHPNAYSVLFNNYITQNNESGIYFEDSLNILISNESGYVQHYNYHLFDSNNWFEEDLNSFSIDPYSTVEFNFSPSNINGETSSLTFNIQPIYHSYDSKSYNFNIYSSQISGDLNADGVLNILDVVILVGIVLDNGEVNFYSDVNSDGVINILDIVTLINLILN